MILSEIKSCGYVYGKIEHKCGKIEKIKFPNTVLKTGREALASSISNTIGDNFQLYVNRMIFGDGGTVAGVTKVVNASRNGLFGITRSSRPVIAIIDPNISTQVIFTSVQPYNDTSNGYELSEMALQLATGDLFSMVTFPIYTKTSQQQITWYWRASWI